jgi:predicted MFS family arabinose efflux permease
VSLPSPAPLRRNRDFVLLQVGQGFSTLGSTSVQIAYPLLVLATTHSPAKAGVVGFANIVPYALFALFAGVAADRWNRKRVMIAMDLVRAFGMTSVVVASAIGELTFALVAVVAFLEGTAFVFFNIAEVGALRSVVAARQLPAAAAAEQARMASVTLAGPPLGGALFGLGRSLPFVVDAASYGFSILSLLWMRTPFQEARERDDTPLRAQMREGVTWLWRQPYLRTSALVFAGNNFVFQAIFLTFVVVARRHGLSSGEIGALIAAFGTCALLGSLAAPRAAKALSIRTIMLLNQWLNGLFVLYLVEPSPYTLVACVLPAAFAGPWLNAVVIGYRTAVTPDHLVGRVSSVARNIALLAQPLGPLTAGLLLGAFSARATVVTLAALCVALAAFSTVSPSIRHAPSLSELDDLPTPAL